MVGTCRSLPPDRAVALGIFARVPDAPVRPWQERQTMQPGHASAPAARPPQLYAVGSAQAAPPTAPPQPGAPPVAPTGGIPPSYGAPPAAPATGLGVPGYSSAPPAGPAQPMQFYAATDVAKPPAGPPPVAPTAGYSGGYAQPPLPPPPAMGGAPDVAHGAPAVQGAPLQPAMYQQQQPYGLQPPLPAQQQQQQQQQPYGQAPGSQAYGDQAYGAQAPNGHAYGAAAAMQQQKIDPRAAPRPQAASSDASFLRYRTSMKEGQPPPGVFQTFGADDTEGSASPRYLRSCTAAMPASARVLKEAMVPMGLILTPLAEVPSGADEAAVPVEDLRALENGGPPRCGRCGAFLNLFAKFVQHGNLWQCNLCGGLNTVPPVLVCPLDGTGRRLDASSRPMLCRGSVEYLVGPSYSLRPPQEDMNLVLLDTSTAAHLCGAFDASVAALLSLLPELPAGAQVALACFDACGVTCIVPPRPGGEADAPAALLHVGDAEDPFAPLPFTDWALPADSPLLRDAVRACPELLAAQCEAGAPRGAGACGTAMRFAVEALAACGGRCAFVSRGGAVGGCGALRDRREDMPPGSYGSEDGVEERLCRPARNEASVLGRIASAASIASEALGLDANGAADGNAEATGAVSSAAAAKDAAAGEAYATTARLAVQRNVAIDGVCVTTAGEWLDVATLGDCCAATGGRLQRLASGRGEGALGEGIEAALRCALLGSDVSDVAMRVRCSVGMEVERVIGPGMSAGGAHKEHVLSRAGAQSGFAVELTHRGEFRGDKAFVQAAMLFTTRAGERRVRVHNLRLPLAKDVGAVFASSDQDAMACFLAKRAAAELARPRAPLLGARNVVLRSVCEMLRCYRERLSGGAPSTKLVLPDSLQLLPLAALAALKSDMLRTNARGGAAPDPSGDDRALARIAATADAPAALLRAMLPVVYRVSEAFLDGGADAPEQLPCSAEFLGFEDVLLMDAGRELFLWIGRSVTVPRVKRILGIEAWPEDLAGLRVVDEGLGAFIGGLQAAKPHPAPLYVLPSGAGGPKETRMLGRLIEDRFGEGASYVEFLCTVHEYIRAKLKGTRVVA